MCPQHEPLREPERYPAQDSYHSEAQASASNSEHSKVDWSPNQRAADLLNKGDAGGESEGHSKCAGYDPQPRSGEVSANDRPLSCPKSQSDDTQHERCARHSPDDCENRYAER